MIMRALVLAAAASAAILEPIGYDREGSALAFLTNAGVEATAADVADLNKDAPSLVAMLAMATDAPEQLADLIKASPMSVVADEVDMPAAGAGDAALPVVVAHGMGDSCYNSGMKSITEAAGKKLNAYATCVPTAEGWLFDTIDGFLKNIDKSVDFFAEKIRADPKLAGGFNAFGFSQGNNVIRGYITKYNDPPVKNFMSICGINAGVGAFPQCSPEIPVVGPTVCDSARRQECIFAYVAPRISKNSDPVALGRSARASRRSSATSPTTSSSRTSSSRRTTTATPPRRPTRPTSRTRGSRAGTTRARSTRPTSPTGRRRTTSSGSRARSTRSSGRARASSGAPWTPRTRGRPCCR